MDLSDRVRKGGWVRAEDCINEDLRLTIKSVFMQEHKFQPGAEQVVLKLTDGRCLGLNTANERYLVNHFGPETDAWVGRVIECYPIDMTIKGEEKLVLKVRMAQTRAGAKKVATPAPASPPLAGLTSGKFADGLDAEDDDEFPG